MKTFDFSLVPSVVASVVSRCSCLVANHSSVCCGSSTCTQSSAAQRSDGYTDQFALLRPRQVLAVLQLLPHNVVGRQAHRPHFNILNINSQDMRQAAMYKSYRVCNI